jgi:hypothetical protein
MRKTLLIAAAALASSVISSQAGVYSQNIVGYANIVTPTAGNNYLLTIPFTIGVSNGANEVFGTSLQGAAAFTQVLLWNPNTSIFTLYQSDPGSATGWDDNNFNSVPAPILPVGAAFFFVPTAPLTNVFAGAVAVNVGSTNSLVLPTAGDNYFVGSPIPYAGSVTNGTSTGGGLNLSFPSAFDFTQVLTWDPIASAFTLFQTDHGSVSGWDDNNFNAVAPPSLNVGEGFVIVPSAANLTWTQGL